MKKLIAKMSLAIVMIATMGIMSSFLINTEIQSQKYFVVYGFDYAGNYDKNLKFSSVIISDVIKAECGYSVGKIESEMKAEFRKYYEKNQSAKRGIEIRDISIQNFPSYDEAVAGKRKIIKTYEPKQLDPLQLNYFTFHCND
ncbi:MAG: hypothetical protein ABIN48_03875 [Ginsengibacter sp.]